MQHSGLIWACHLIWVVPTLDFRGKSWDFVPTTGGEEMRGALCFPNFWSKFSKKKLICLGTVRLDCGFPTHPGKRSLQTQFAPTSNFSWKFKLVGPLLHSEENTCLHYAISKSCYSFHRPRLKQSTFCRRRSSRGCKRQEAGIQFRYIKRLEPFILFFSKSTWT